MEHGFVAVGVPVGWHPPQSGRRFRRSPSGPLCPAYPCFSRPAFQLTDITQNKIEER